MECYGEKKLARAEILCLFADRIHGPSHFFDQARLGVNANGSCGVHDGFSGAGLLLPVRPLLQPSGQPPRSSGAPRKHSTNVLQTINSVTTLNSGPGIRP